MARIRTIKPEFWTDEKVVELSLESRLFFIGLWNFADEHGNCEGSEKRLKMQIFPADNFDVKNSILEILRVGLISDYEVEGKKYIHINNFNKHQKVNTKTAHKYPPPPAELLADQSDKKALEVFSLEKEKEYKSPKSDEEPENPPDDPVSPSQNFEELWKSWPDDLGEKGNKKRAHAQWDRLRPDDDLVNRMRSGLDAQVRYKRTMRIRKEFTPNFQHVERWIRDQGWEDPLPPLPVESETSLGRPGL